MVHSCEVLGVECAIIWHKDSALPSDTNAVIIPGGFSYGDYLRCGAIAKFSPIMRAVREFADNGGVVFGICNGFQILCESGLLPGALIRNKNINFIAQNAELEVVSTNNALLKNYRKHEKITLPIAHAEGNFYAPDAVLESMHENDQILLKYTQDINGSRENIAGICNETRNVFGIMPHPERAIEAELGAIDGLKMLQSIYGA